MYFSDISLESKEEEKCSEKHPMYVLLEKEESCKEKTKNCDEIFAEYLKEVASLTCPEYFRKVTQFILLYRECLNKFGWLKHFAKLKTDSAEISLTQDEAQQLHQDFSATNNGIEIPEIVNEFLQAFIPERNVLIPIEECINLTVNLTRWLFDHHYSTTKIVLSNET